MRRSPPSSFPMSVSPATDSKMCWIIRAFPLDRASMCCLSAGAGRDSGRVIVAGKIVRIPQDPYLLLIVIHDRRGDQMINIDIKSLISGILVCFITVISSTYILLKTGSGTVIDTVMLSIICLCIIRGFRRESVLLSDIFARSAVSANANYLFRIYYYCIRHFGYPFLFSV